MEGKKQIVFIESYSTIMIYKIAKLFKNKDYETILIRILEPSKLDRDFCKDAYDRVIDFNISKLNIKGSFKQTKDILSSIIKILSLKPYIIIGKANPNLPIAFFRILFRKTPFVYFPYDIRCLYCHPDMESAMKLRGISKFEIWAERFNFENADGVMHKGAEEELEHLNGRMLGNNINLPKHQIHFYPYCSKEFLVPLNKNKLSKKTKEIHMVYFTTGSCLTSEACKPFLALAKEMDKLKMHFHLYIYPTTNNKNEIVNIFDSKYFHLHNPAGPREIAKEISQYDFGISLYWDNERTSELELEEKHFDLERNYGIGNKIATFLEAGIPHFCPPEMICINRILEKYKIRILINPNNFSNIKDIQKKIKRLNYKKLEQNILKAREDFDMDKNFPRFEKFIQEVVAEKLQGVKK